VKLLPRHLRGALIAIVVFAMSTGIAYAARPAADHATNAVTNTNTEASGEPDESSEPDESESPDESGSPDQSGGDSGTNCTTDPTTLTPDQLAAMSHGSIVCWAAQQETPEGWDNHGAWVRHWAQMNHGSDASSNGKTNGAAGKARGQSHRGS